MVDACEVFREAGKPVEEAHVLQYMAHLLCGRGIQVLWFDETLREQFVGIFRSRQTALEETFTTRPPTLPPPVMKKLELKLAQLKEAAKEVDANIRFPPRARPTSGRFA